MILELRKAVEGTHFVICVVSEKAGKQLVIPLSGDLTEAIDQLLKRDSSPLVMPGFAARKRQ